MLCPDYQLVRHELLAAAIMLHCARAAQPGPDRIFCVWSASSRLDNARRIAKIRRIKLFQRIATLEAVCSELSRDAGEGEAIGDTFEGQIHIVSRDANGNWSQRRERVH